jgi:nucleotide-binding universal stress UspA family protein/GNAT superfamily N-acetyltransferase
VARDADEIVTLRDGSRVRIRPLEPDDRDLLAEGFERLSAESRYRRFFGPVARLRERDLDYLTRVDHHDHEALLALDLETDEGVGVARFVRTGPEVAEPALVVADAWQGRGVGSRLLEALADRARQEGIRRFEAPILATNTDAIRVFERLGDTDVRHEGREVVLTIALPDAPRTGRSFPALLKQFATGTAEPARTAIELIWPRRRGEPGQPRRNVIVVGTDGSDHARQAVDAAAELAALSGAAVEVVGAHRFVPSDQADVAAAVGEAAGALRERGLHVHEEVRRGDPVLVITDVAAERNARLVVVGAGDHSKAARRVVGSVADLVAERAPCNVLIVRPRSGEPTG